MNLLEDARRAGVAVAVWSARAAHFRQMAEGLRSPSAISGERVQGGTGHTAMEDCAIAAADAQAKADEAAARHVRLAREVDSLIAHVPREDLRNVLNMRYVMGMSADQIAAKLNVSKRTYYYWHRDAVLAVEQITRNK